MTIPQNNLIHGILLITLMHEINDLNVEKLNSQTNDDVITIKYYLLLVCYYHILILDDYFIYYAFLIHVIVRRNNIIYSYYFFVKINKYISMLKMIENF